MAYLGNDLQVAYQSYKIIDDISSSFNSSLTSFPLEVGGVAPVPFPINPQQCLISVNGVVQEPDPTGTSGFNLVGSNIVFASAPTTGHSFFGVILAGADYVNVGVNYPSGSESAPSITFDTDLDTGIYNPAANELGLVTNGNDAVRINSSGDVTIGSDLTVDTDTLYVDSANDRVGIGTTSPDSLFHVNGGTVNTVARFESTDSIARIVLKDNSGESRIGTVGDNITFHTSSGEDERMRIDSSGRLLVGTSSARKQANIFTPLQVETTGSSPYAGIGVIANTSNATGPSLLLSKTRGTANGSTTIVQDNDDVGSIWFTGADGTDLTNAAARIFCQVDGTPGANDMPGRLVFSTTADGASSPTERLFIDSSGRIGSITAPNSVWPAIASSSGVNGASFGTAGTLTTSSNATACIYVNRNNADGNLIQFYSTGTLEGAISVSGTTVTYGGGHLARWSQLLNDQDPSNILKGTVMSNLDEMCKWGEEDNEQLNKTKVSDVEGDPNVAGVFVSTSFDDEGPADFFVAMTGDMIIRIAEGVTVQRGQLLMSAGDGTAKPQGDGYVQDKTIAKVTSTHVACTYDDGSYCVPCVLMAC